MGETDATTIENTLTFNTGTWTLTNEKQRQSPSYKHEKSK